MLMLLISQSVKVFHSLRGQFLQLLFDFRTSDTFIRFSTDQSKSLIFFLNILNSRLNEKYRN